MALDGTGAEAALSSTPVETTTSTTSTPASTPTESTSTPSSETTLSNLVNGTTPSTPSVNLEELQSKLNTYEPAYKYLEKYGGPEVAEPFFGVVDTLIAPQFNPGQFAKQLATIDQARYNDFIWDRVDAHKEAVAEYILSDAAIRDAVLGQDPDYQQFQQWKAAGGPTAGSEQDDLKALEGLDPSDPLYAVVQRAKARDAELNRLKQEFEKNQRSQREQYEQAQLLQQEQKKAAYINEQETWLTNQIKALNWGDEFKRESENIKHVVEQKFMADPEAKNALLTAANYAANGSPVMAKRFTQVVQAKLSQIFKAEVEHENRKIQEIRQYRDSIRKNQESRKEIPSGGGRENASLGGTELTGKTMEERVLERVLRGVQAGRLPDIFGNK